MYEPASLGMFQCRLQRILCDFEVIMFFRKDLPQTEGRRHADPLIKTEPADWTGRFLWLFVHPPQGATDERAP